MEALRERVAERLDDIKCPRCQVSPAYPLGKDLGALSRTDEVREIVICPDCGGREALAEETIGLIPPEEWPLSIDQLLTEDRLRLEFGRGGHMERLDL